MSRGRRSSSFRVVNRRTSVLQYYQPINTQKGDDEVYEQICKQLNVCNSQTTLIRALNTVYELSGGDINNGDPRDQTRDDLYRKGIVHCVVGLMDMSAIDHLAIIKTCCKVLRNLARNDSINKSLGSEYNLCIKVLSLIDDQLNPSDLGKKAV